MALMKPDGSIEATYTYDPWGAVTVTDPMGSVNGNTLWIGNANPLRYRGYYYDTESGFYYLQSRYYDPAIGRFISADTFATTDANGFLSCNMFAYCENDPVNKQDLDGELPQVVVGALVGAVVGAGLEVATQLISGTKLSNINWKSVAIEGASGAATGALLSAGLPAQSVKMGRAAINGITSFAHEINQGSGIAEASKSALISASTTMIFGSTKSAGRQLTNGSRAKLSGIGQRVKKWCYQPKYLKATNTIKATMTNRLYRWIPRIAKSIYSR